MPLFNEVKQLKCDNCGYTFEDIVNTGKLGCENCYSVFENRLDPIIKKIQGSNKHVGRTGKIIDSKISEKINNKDSKTENNKDVSKVEKLQNDLKKAIKEEKYEEAAKIRDEIKKIEGKK